MLLKPDANANSKLRRAPENQLRKQGSGGLYSGEISAELVISIFSAVNTCYMLSPLNVTNEIAFWRYRPVVCCRGHNRLLPKQELLP